MRMLIVLVAIVLAASMALTTETLGQMQTPPPGGQRSPSPGSQSPTSEEKIVKGQVKNRSLPNGDHLDGRHQARGAAGGSH